MAVPAIVPQPAFPSESVLQPLADLLKQIHAADPAFCRALDRAVARIQSGIAYEPYNATHYRIQSFSRPWMWHYVTLHQCPCDTQGPWCWHRALLHLLTALAALAALDRCPRPTLAHVPQRQPRDMNAILLACDEMNKEAQP